MVLDTRSAGDCVCSIGFAGISAIDKTGACSLSSGIRVSMNALRTRSLGISRQSAHHTYWLLPAVLSSATICTPARLFRRTIDSPVHLGRQRYSSNCRKASTLRMQGKGAPCLSPTLQLQAPFPCNPIPQPQIFTDRLRSHCCGNPFHKILRRESL